MILVKTVQPNFIKLLSVLFIGGFSVNAFAEHHGKAEKKVGDAAEMVKEEKMTSQLVPVEEANLSEEELKLKMENEEDKAKMKKMMMKDAKEAPEAE